MAPPPPVRVDDSNRGLDTGFRRYDDVGVSPLFWYQRRVSCSRVAVTRGVSGPGVVESMGAAPGVGFVPVLFEFFVDSTLGDGELCGCGFFVLFLLYALGPQGLSANGGPGVSVPAALCSGASSSGLSSFVPGSFGGLRVSGVGCGVTAPAAPLGSRFRGNDDCIGGNDG